MSGRSTQNPVFRATRALGQLIGSHSLPTTEFPAIAPAPEPDEGLQVPEPTYAFGSFGEIVPNPDPPPPTRAQLHDLAQIRAALAVEDPWAEGLWAENPPFEHAQEAER